MEALEGQRDGSGIKFRLKIQAQLTVDGELSAAQEEVICGVSQSDWVTVLEHCGYRKTLLLEIPMPEGERDTAAQRHLDMARSHLLRGHYEEAVAACRKALEGWTTQRGEVEALKKARDTQRSNPRALTLYNRELLLRQAASNFSDLSHHADEVANAEHFDRSDATMMIAITASILSRAK